MRALRAFSSCEMPMRSSRVRVQVRAAMACRRASFSGAMNSPPSLQSAMKAKSSSSCASVSRQRGARAAASGSPAAMACRQAISASRFKHLEAHAHFVDAVVEGFQLGRLVDHVFRRRHLAAVVQPGGDVDRFPFLVVELEILDTGRWFRRRRRAPASWSVPARGRSGRRCRGSWRRWRRRSAG